MKRLLTLVLAAFAFAACTQNEVEELTANREALPETLTVGFEGGDTRVELNEALKTVWSKGDEVSVFYLSDANQKWQYQGETGERLGTLKCVDQGVAEEKMQRVVVAYPYNAQYVVNTDTHNLYASLPAVQSYKEGSYGSEGNIMVAQSEFTQFSLKSVVGWLRVELTGEGQKVDNITLRGNAGEQVAGLIYVDTATAEATLASEMGEASDEEQVGGVGGGLEFDDTVFTEVTLDCGDGVELGAEATAFYIALLPQTFEKGVTIEVDYANAEPQTLICESSITISRNHISPIESEANVEVEVPSNQLWYTSTALVEPNNTSAFNAAIVSNEWDEATYEGVITFDGELTTIGASAFYGCYSLTSVTIGDSVTTIGDFAFSWCESLTSVTIGDGVTAIGEAAFASCSSLTEFKGKFAEDGGRCLIKDNAIIAYANASGTTYTIPDSVTTIGYEAFRGCYDLTSITIPDSVTTIGDFAFSWCESLTSVTIPDSVTTIGDYAFSDCHSLTSVTIPDSVTTIGGCAFYVCESLTSITIPDSVTKIGIGAFYDCDSLTSVTIPDSVTTIGRCAFENCDSLTSVTIPDSVLIIDYGAFANCSNLTTVYCRPIVPPTNTNYEYGSHIFDTNIEGFCIYVSEDYVDTYINDESWSIYADYIVGYPFDGITYEDNKIIKYKASAKIEPYDTSAFGATYLGSTWDEATGEGVITFDGNVSKIGDNAFRYCTALQNITIPNSVASIGNYAFLESGIRSLELSDRVTTIGNYAFHSCYNLEEVALGDNVRSIGDEAFSYCGFLQEIDLGSGQMSIGYRAFAGCLIHHITIPENATLCGNVFAGCSLLAKFEGNYATDDGIALISRDIWFGNEFIAFAPACRITEYTIPADITAIVDQAFDRCDSLTSVTIPDSVTSIGSGAFYDCNALTSVYCKAITPPILGSRAFAYYDNDLGDFVNIGSLIYVPAESVEEYKSAAGWSEYADYIVGYDFE